jgi:hypothetical protein
VVELLDDSVGRRNCARGTTKVVGEVAGELTDRGVAALQPRHVFRGCLQVEAAAIRKPRLRRVELGVMDDPGCGLGDVVQVRDGVMDSLKGVPGSHESRAPPPLQSELLWS